jgi:hypothetical protein
MDTVDDERLSQVFESWNRETLLEELIQREEDFVPRAREALRAELLRRGVSEATIAQARKAFLASRGEDALPLEELRVVDTFGDRLSAEAARNLLDQHGVAGEVYGSERLLFGPGLLALGPEPVTLKVMEHDLDKAQAILADFLPASDEEIEAAEAEAEADEGDGEDEG